MNVQCSFDCVDLVAGMTIERFGLGTLFCGEGGQGSGGGAGGHSLKVELIDECSMGGSRVEIEWKLEVLEMLERYF